MNLVKVGEHYVIGVGEDEELSPVISQRRAKLIRYLERDAGSHSLKCVRVERKVTTRQRQGEIFLIRRCINLKART